MDGKWSERLLLMCKMMVESGVKWRRGTQALSRRHVERAGGKHLHAHQSCHTEFSLEMIFWWWEIRWTWKQSMTADNDVGRSADSTKLNTAVGQQPPNSPVR